MGKTLIKVDCVDQRLIVSNNPLIAAGGRNEDVIEFSFCPLWDNFEKTAVFYRDENAVYHIPIENDKCVIPHEVLAEEGWMYFGVFGTTEDARRTTAISKYRIERGAITGYPLPSDPSNDIYALYLEQILRAEEAASTAEEAAKNADEACFALLNGFEDVAPAIVVTAAGDMISLHDTRVAPFKGLKLFGKTTQEGTPTPETPIPLVNVGESGSIGVNVYGKNLFTTDINNPIDVTYIGSSGTATTRKGFVIPLPVGTYTASCPTAKSISEKYLYGCVCDKDGRLKTSVILLANKQISKVTFDITNGDTLILYNALTTTTENTKVLFATYPVQIEAGSVATEYEAPKPVQTLVVQTPNGLPGIPVTGGNYTDENGQQWACDEIDLERGIYVQRIAVIENYNSETITTAYVSSTGALTTGAYVQYILFEPIETPLAAEEIAAYKVLRHNYPNTTVLNDAGAGMDVKCAADTKLYIDGKFEELRNAIISTGGNV